MAKKENLDVLTQSKAAYGQWAPQWREHAKAHAKFQMKPLSDFNNIGIGKAILVIANGYSFEQNIETIKKHQHNVDILCVDKCLRHCLDHGIIPTYCLVCDANVSYETYLEPVKDQLAGITLFNNVCGNPKWTDGGNWKERYFFVNKDVLSSEKEFCELSGCGNVIAAGTNVSNAALVLLTQCDNHIRQNFFGYDKILLIGYDYSWTDEGYYAFNKDGGGKNQYMKTVYVFNLDDKLCFTSTNLLFSAKWMDKYINAFKIPVVQCSKSSLLQGRGVCDLGTQMRYLYKPDDSVTVRALVRARREFTDKLHEINAKMAEISNDHHLQLIRTT